MRGAGGVPPARAVRLNLSVSFSLLPVLSFRLLSLSQHTRRFRLSIHSTIMLNACRSSTLPSLSLILPRRPRSTVPAAPTSARSPWPTTTAAGRLFRSGGMNLMDPATRYPSAVDARASSTTHGGSGAVENPSGHYLTPYEPEPAQELTGFRADRQSTGEDPVNHPGLPGGNKCRVPNRRNTPRHLRYTARTCPVWTSYITSGTQVLGVAETDRGANPVRVHGRWTWQEICSIWDSPTANPHPLRSRLDAEILKDVPSLGSGSHQVWIWEVRWNSTSPLRKDLP